MRFRTSGNHPHSNVLKDTARYPIHLQWYYLLYNFVLLKSRCCHPSLRVRILSRVYAACGGQSRDDVIIIIVIIIIIIIIIIISTYFGAAPIVPTVQPRTSFPQICGTHVGVAKQLYLVEPPSTVRKFIAHVVVPSTLNPCDFPLLWLKYDLAY